MDSFPPLGFRHQQGVLSLFSFIICCVDNEPEQLPDSPIQMAANRGKAGRKRRDAVEGKDCRSAAFTPVIAIRVQTAQLAPETDKPSHRVIQTRHAPSLTQILHKDIKVLIKFECLNAKKEAGSFIIFK